VPRSLLIVYFYKIGYLEPINEVECILPYFRMESFVALLIRFHQNLPDLFLFIVARNSLVLSTIQYSFKKAKIISNFLSILWRCFQVMWGTNFLGLMEEFDISLSFSLSEYWYPLCIPVIVCLNYVYEQVWIPWGVIAGSRSTPWQLT
jgi:hypothetical protein